MKPHFLENELLKLQRQINQMRKNFEIIEAIISDLRKDVNREIVEEDIK